MDAGILETLTPFLAPLPGEDPCGIDERHAHNYLETDNEVKKLSGVRQETVDWERVLELSSELLKTSTKDLKLAGCLTLAWFYLEGYSGLDRGLYVLVELLDKYWEQVHPRPRSPTNLRRRASPLRWFNGLLQKTISMHPPSPQDVAAFVSIEQNAKRYKDICMARFEGQGPAFEELLTTIARATESMDLKAATERQEDSDAKAQDNEISSASEPPPKVQSQEQKAPTPEATAPGSEPDFAQAAQIDSMPADIESLLAPISEDQPSGQDERYNEKFELAREQATLLDAHLSDKKPDWESTLEYSVELLQSSTKDLNLAAYVTLAKLDQDGIQGLGHGLMLVAELVDRFWESIYPLPRSASNYKRRASPLNWLNKHIEKRLSGYEVRSEDGPAIDYLNSATKKYAKVCNSRFENAPPATRPLLESANRLSIVHAELSAQQAAPVEEPAPAQTETAPAESVALDSNEPAANSEEPKPAPPPAKLDTPDVQQAPTDLAQVSDYLSNVGESLSEIARQLREAEPTNALSYRLHREAVWMHLTTAPPANNGTKTSVPPLPDQVRQQLETLLNHENWTHLLDEAESRLDKFRFSLDLHRYVVTALKGMGQSKEAVTNVIAELRALLTRMPCLLELEFSNGTPLADDKTTAWILSDVLAGSGGASTSVETTDDAWFEPISNAVESGEHPEILCAMQSALKDAPDQIQFVQRALKGAAQLRSVPGLSLLLAQLAHQAVHAMSGSGRVVHSGLETECLQLLLQLRSSNAARSAQVAKQPELMPLAVELGQRDLASALAYFAP